MGKNNWKIKLGLVLIIVSAFIFMTLLLVPFLNIDNRNKLTHTTVIIIIGEIVFWSGGLLLGKELFSKYKSYLNPKNWFKKKLGKRVDNS